MEPTSNSISFEVQASSYKEGSNQVEAAVNSAQLGKSNILPTSVQPYSLGNIVLAGTKNPEYFVFVSQDAHTLIAKFSFRDTFSRSLLSIPQIAIYPDVYATGEPIDSALAWPNANFGMLTFPCSVIPNDGSYSTDGNPGVVVACRNNSGSDMYVTISLRPLLIINQSEKFDIGLPAA
jgi:hypothetical protein